ncbi:MAG: YgjV family protein, partial [Pyrinomonadaceae bacterium]|nr:YgjV family protein [Pyrinomonadaceae bacterium]
EWIGWVATGMFAVSYLCKQPVQLRLVQALAAVLWIGYGMIISAAPVIVANSVVAVMATYSAWREHTGGLSPSPDAHS